MNGLRHGEDSPLPEGIGDLAKRWWKAKKTELLTGNVRKREYADAEAGNLQREMGDRAMNQAARTAVPAFARFQDRQAAAAAEQDARERDAILARPRVATTLTVAGPWGNGSWQGELPAQVERERDEETGEVTLRVTLETVDDLAPVLLGQPLYALRLELRPYTGPGRYDPATQGDDPMAYTFEYAYREEAFYYVVDAGPGMVEISAGEQQLDLGLPMQGAAGDLRLTATIALPPIRDPQAERAAAEAEQRRAYLAGFPKAAVELSVAGPALSGAWSGELAALVERDGALEVALVPTDEAPPQLAGLPLLGLRLEVPGCTGPGHYDLRADAGEDTNVLGLGSEDEPFRWTPGAGPGSVDVGPDGRTLDVRMAMRGPAGDLQLAAKLTLPAG